MFSNHFLVPQNFSPTQNGPSMVYTYFIPGFPYQQLVQTQPVRVFQPPIIQIRQVSNEESNVDADKNRIGNICTTEDLNLGVD